MRLTTTAFLYHIPGLFFIALNRILAPAFYAQSDSKSPTLAGLVSFGVNMALAAFLVGPMKGGGVALALTFASAVNTVLLLAFLAKNERIAVGRALKASSLYALKLAAFSLVAVTPVVLLADRIAAPFEGRGRLIAHGVPLALLALMFGAIGVALLAATKDRQAAAVAAAFSRKKKTVR